MMHQLEQSLRPFSEQVRKYSSTDVETWSGAARLQVVFCAADDTAVLYLAAYQSRRLSNSQQVGSNEAFRTTLTAVLGRARHAILSRTTRLTATPSFRQTPRLHHSLLDNQGIIVMRDER